MSKLSAIARTGLVAVLLHPLRSGATLLCLVAVLSPYVAGAGVARGLADAAETSVRMGADAYVTGIRFGRPAPVPLSLLDAVRGVPGVREAFPRIVGEIALGRDHVPAVVVGIPADRVPSAARFVEGRMFQPGAGNELVLGAELARRLAIQVGARIPPFYRSRSGERVSKVVGIFRADLPLWEANLVFCSFETAAQLFDQEGLATSLLVRCEPGYRDSVVAALRQLPPVEDTAAAAQPGAPGDTAAAGGPVTPIVTTRDDLRALLPRGMAHLEGIFQIHFVLAFAVGIPLLMVAAGLGLSGRRREAALLKATGWMTDEVLLQGMVESLVLALIGASAAVLLAWVWMDAFNARGIAGIFLPGAGSSPAFRVPFRLAPVPALLGFVVSFAIVSTGTLYSTWRAATAEPALALR
jgi:ABC-type lipoprotein release transport system permease subunit